jgi:hypothetical protein
MNERVQALGRDEHDTHATYVCGICRSQSPRKPKESEVCYNCGRGCAACAPGGAVTNCDECDRPVCVDCWRNIKGMKVCPDAACVAKAQKTVEESMAAAVKREDEQAWKGRKRGGK